jgi:hypothetical protein
MPRSRQLSSRARRLDGLRRYALVVGHPGHELRVFGWMSEYKPRVYVITDGSGRSGISRTSSTAALLERLGIRHGEPFGAMSDAEAYGAILTQDPSRFLKLVDELAFSFIRRQIDCVAGDAAEGFNPTHDVCRALVNAAVLLAQRMTGTEIANFEFLLTEWEQQCAEPLHDEHCLHWTLDDQLLSEKIAAAERYAELKDEVRRAVGQHGEGYFRRECLRKVVNPVPRYDPSKKPFYETWGERQVSKGEYQSVIRLKEHIAPLLDAIFHHAEQASLSPLAAVGQD